MKFPETSAGSQATMATVITTLEDLIRDLDIEEPIGPDTRVVADLGFESIDLIQMAAALEQAFRPNAFLSSTCWSPMAGTLLICAPPKS